MKLKRVAVLGAVVTGAIAVIVPGPRLRKTVRHELDRLARTLRLVGGRLRGVAYDLGGGRPAPDVADDILADRVRSTIGPVTKRLDLPRIHVMVQDHVALLHGAVATQEEADELRRSVARVSGIVGVESYLHLGLGRGDTRPSEGAPAHASGVLQRLVDAAQAAGIPAIAAPAVTRAVLGVFAERLPKSEREHVAAHLPDDARALFTPPERTHELPAPRTVQELVARVATAAPDLPHERALDATRRVVQALAAVVPEEVGDVIAVLPPELRPLWTGEGLPTTTPTR